MTQQKFLWTSNNVQPSGGIIQGDNGIVTVVLRDQIIVTHNYKKNNEILIEFKDDHQDKFRVNDDRDLEEIYKIHLGNINLIETLHKWCEEHLKKA